MSLNSLRDAVLWEKKKEILSCESSRKRKLRELYHYSGLLSAGHPPQQHDWIIADEPNENERLFLDENDISKGRTFREETLPPILPLHPSFAHGIPSSSKSTLPPAFKASPSPTVVPSRPGGQPQVAFSTSTPQPSQPSPTVQVPVSDSSPIVQSPLETSQPFPPRPLPTATPSVVDGANRSSQDDVRQLNDAPGPPQPRSAPDIQERDLDGPSADPKDVVPPAPEGDAAALTDSAVPPPNVEQKPSAPQTVHLPPQDEQEQRLEETEHRLQQAAEREQKEEEKLAHPPTTAAAEPASSPSSTVGPFSATTPRPQNHSPATSPGSETYHDTVSHNATTDPVAVLAKQTEKEDEMDQQAKEAREPTPVRSPDTPDAQVQLEHEQAIRLARDGKSRLTEDQPPSGPAALTEHAQDVVDEVETVATEAKRSASHQENMDSLPTPATTAPDSASANHENFREKSCEPRMTEHLTPPADVKDVEMEDAPADETVVEARVQEPDRSKQATPRTSPRTSRQKSLSDVIQEAAPPKVLTPRSGNATPSVSPAKPRSRAKHGKAPVSTVIFAKQDANRAAKALQLWSEDYASLQGASQDSSRDYLQGLFNYQAHLPPRSTPLQDLLTSARKTVSTSASLATLRECQDYKILKRVYQLQNANRWSLRQLQKSAEPPRPPSHLDQLLCEMKWMQTDFKEERKWKKAVAAMLAGWCAEYVNSGPEERTSLRIRRYIPSTARRKSDGDEEMNDAATPDLVSEGESFMDEEELQPIFEATPPTALFSLGFDDVVMKLERTPAAEAIFAELPRYEPDLEGASDVSRATFCDPPLLPVSKFVTGKLVSSVRGPPRKRSRYEYDSEDEPTRPPSRSATSAEHSMPSTPGRRFNRNDLPPEMANVALFNPENKHVRDRLQAAHHFRPPSEFGMPSVAFYENRVPSQWLWDEDQKLRQLVREYTFNWSLVAQELSLPSAFTASSERRTPWECFERWVNLEGMPVEMSKTPYFRTYQARLEQAQKTVAAQQQAQQQLLQQQAGNSQQNIPAQLRRRSTQPIRVERRRNNRYLALIDAMRKLAKKRESAVHKQQESQKAAALRKAHEPVAQKSNVRTPQEFSRLKWEREQKAKQLAQQQLLQRQAMVAAAAQRQAAGMAGQPGMQVQVPNGMNVPQRNGTPGGGGTTLPVPNPGPPGHPSAAPGMQPRPHPGQAPSMRGGFGDGSNMAAMAMGAAGIPQAQMQANMQANMQNQQRMGPPDNMRMAMQQRQYPANQHQFQLQQQQQQINMASNIANAHLGAANGMQNPAMMAALGQNMNGMASMNGMAGNPAAQRVGQPNTPGLAAAARSMPPIHMIQEQLKAQHPEWTVEQVAKAASDQLTKLLHRNRAMSAAAGQSAMGNSASPTNQMRNNVYLQNGGGLGGSPPSTVQTYQSQLLQQQRMMSQSRQQQVGSPSMGSARPPSRSATPQNHPQQQQLQQQSPAMQQAQIARN